MALGRNYVCYLWDCIGCARLTMDTTSKFNVKVVDRIAKLPEEDWKSVFPKALENYHFFKTLDESFSDQFKFFYILVYKDDLPVGATSCFITNFPLSIAVKGFFKNFLGFIERIIPCIFNPRTLICGLPMGEGRIGIIGDSEAVMREINSTLGKLAKEQKAQLIIYKDFNSSYKDMFKPVIKNGYLKMESFPSTDMEIDFGDFEWYLESRA